MLKRLLLAVALVVAPLAIATPAHAATGPQAVLLHDSASIISICYVGSACWHTFKVHDSHGNLVALCVFGCVPVDVIHGPQGWAVCLSPGPCTGPMARKP